MEMAWLSRMIIAFFSSNIHLKNQDKIDENGLAATN